MAKQEKIREKRINSFLKKISDTLNPAITRILKKDVDPQFLKLAEYQIAAGGKRLRPALLMLSCFLLGGKKKDALKTAIAMEILHNYTLIVDDIIDNSPLRRRKKTVWKKFGQSAAECAGIYYAASIFQVANTANQSKIISEILARKMKHLVSGEIMDILCDRTGKDNEPFVKKHRLPEVQVGDYLKMIKRKTAGLFEASCELGGICANGKKNNINQLKKYGHNLGMAFQISDDILDIFGNEKSFGKQVGRDIIERKGGNIIILLALQELKSKKNSELSFIVSREKITHADLKKAIALISQTSAKEKAMEMGKRYIDAAKKNLKKLPQNKWISLMSDISDSIMSREK